MDRAILATTVVWVAPTVGFLQMALAQTPPGCIGCTPAERIPKEVRVYTDLCDTYTFGTLPYGKFTEHCQRFDCSNGAYYLREPDDMWDGTCHATYYYSACPGNTCP